MKKERGGQKMSLRTFKGGVHPYDGKELTKEKPVKENRTE